MEPLCFWIHFTLLDVFDQMYGRVSIADTQSVGELWALADVVRSLLTWCSLSAEALLCLGCCLESAEACTGPRPA